MSVDTDTPPPAPDIPAPGKEDAAVRSAATGGKKPRAARVPAAPPADPEAPFGWMTDPKTGERRPKKRPGRQATSVSPPPSRPATQARDRKATDAEKEKAKTAPAGDTTTTIKETLQGTWMILAGIPTPEKPVKFLGIDVQALSIRAKAQAAVIEENAAGLTKAATLCATHNRQFARGLEKWGGETGPAWVLPAMMAVLPFAFQSAQVWKVPVAGDLTELAKKVDAEFEELVKSMSIHPERDGTQDGPGVSESPNGKTSPST